MKSYVDVRNNIITFFPMNYRKQILNCTSSNKIRHPLTFWGQMRYPQEFNANSSYIFEKTQLHKCISLKSCMFLLSWKWENVYFEYFLHKVSEIFETFQFFFQYVECLHGASHYMIRYKKITLTTIQLILKLFFCFMSYFSLIMRHASFIWNKVFKNGPSEICGRQPLKTLKG